MYKIGYALGGMCAGAVAGLLFGFAPMAVGYKKNQQRLGAILGLACIGVGFFMGWIGALVVALISVAVIFYVASQAETRTGESQKIEQLIEE